MTFVFAFLYSWIDVLDLNQHFNWSAQIWEPFQMKLIWGLQSWPQWEWTMLQDHRIFCWRKKTGGFGEYNMSRSLPIWETTWWCLSVLGSILKFVMNFVVKYIMLEKKYLKFSWSPEHSGISRNLLHGPPCRTPCRLFIHEVFFGL